MRYADGPTVSVEVHIDAPPTAVWAAVSDINAPARFSAEFQGAEWLDGATEPALGARFRGRNRHDAVGEWETTSTIVACEPEQRLEWAVMDPDNPSASWRFTLEPDGEGTRLRQWMRIGPGPSGLNVAIERMPDKEERIIERRLGEHRANMEATVLGIKELAGTVGAPTLLMVPSTKAFVCWRADPATGEDIWHSSVTHIQAKVFGDGFVEPTQRLAERILSHHLKAGGGTAKQARRHSVASAVDHQNRGVGEPRRIKRGCRVGEMMRHTGQSLCRDTTQQAGVEYLMDHVDVRDRFGRRRPLRVECHRDLVNVV
jgi:uncharacterized protein YndB with AHSA1/START domain